MLFVAPNRRSARRVLGLNGVQLARLGHGLPSGPHEDRRHRKMAFITQIGLFEMTKMFVGLCNAPSIYQRLMKSMLTGLIERICFANLDDVIAFSKRR